MDFFKRRSRATRALAGYPSGPGATGDARESALAHAPTAKVIVLVEGVSDLMALDAVAERQGRDLLAEGIVVVPVGGAHAFSKYFQRFADRAIEVRALVDDAEEGILRTAMSPSPTLNAATEQGLEGQGIFVCIEDLEDELIRAVTPLGVESLLYREGDLGSFRSLQNQPAWRGADSTAQLRRFLGAGSRRKLRYARILALELDPGAVPPQIIRLLRV